MKFSNKVHSFLVLICLFFLAIAMTPVVAEISTHSAMVQTQLNPNQLVTKARELYKKQDFEAALPLWQQAANEFARSGDSLNQAMSLSNLSLTNQQLAQWQAADTAIRKSIEVLNSNQADNLPIFAQTLDIKAKLQRETGQSAEAIASWQQAAKIYQQSGTSQALAQIKLNQAQALQDLGLYPRACKRLLNILLLENISTCKQLSQLTPKELEAELKPLTSKPSLTEVSALGNLGDILLIIGQPKQSETILKTTLSLAKKINAPEELAINSLSYLNISQALQIQAGDVRGKSQIYSQQAIEAYNQVMSLATSPATRLQAQLNRLNFLIEQEEWQETDLLWRSLYAQISQYNLPANRDNIYASINYGQNLIELIAQDNPEISAPSIVGIEKILVGAAEKAQALGDRRLEAYAWGSLGKLKEITNDYTAAKKITQKALSLESSFDAPDLSYQHFWQLGRIHKNQNNIKEAIADYTKAYDALQSLRRDIATINPEVQFSFRDEVEPVYRELVALDVKYTEGLNTKNNNQQVQERLIQAREVIESLQIAQLNNFFREACIDVNPQVVDAIDPNTAVIYPIILPDELAIILSLPDRQPQLYSSKVSQAELEETVRKIRSSLLQNYDLKSDLPQYQQAYNWVIRPLESELATNKIKTIAFVLDGALRNIPMSVLHDGNQYLVEKYALALTPGLQLFDTEPVGAIQLDATTAGLSKVRPNFKPHSGYNDLKEVPVELEQIEKIGLTKRSLLNNQFTQKNLKQSIEDSGSPIVHLATHAKFSSKAEDTFILAWDKRINIKEIDDLLRDDTYNRKNAIKLLVLSACETASGDPRATFGLAGLAVQSGAKSTLATLWSVVDKSTAKFMGDFYRQLQKSGENKANKAEVLRQAQLDLMDNQEFNHPHFWAPFILLGNWQ